MSQESCDAVRRHYIKTRVTVMERTQIFNNADRHNLSVSAFIRARTTMDDMGQSPRPKRNSGLSASEARSVAMTLACMGRMADILRDYQSTPPPEYDLNFMFNHLLRELSENRERCLKAMGKRL